MGSHHRRHLLRKYTCVFSYYKIAQIYFWLRGQESNLGHSAYETGGKPFSPQYGVIDEIRTRFILAPQASALPYEHQSQSQVLDSNQCTRFCRPLPSHSANLTNYFRLWRCFTSDFGGVVHFCSLFTNREQATFVNIEVSKGFEPLPKHP